MITERPVTTLSESFSKPGKRCGPVTLLRKASGRAGAALRMINESVNGVRPIRPHAFQTRLRQQLLLLHAGKGGAVDGKHTNIRVVHFAVELLVMLVKPTEFGIGLHQGFDIITLLVFKHGSISSQVDLRRRNGAGCLLEHARTYSHAGIPQAQARM
jgi:hypothetical protein